MKLVSRLATFIIVFTLALAGVGLYFHPGEGYPWVSYFDRWLIKIVQFSLLQAFLSALLSVFIAIPVAWLLSYRSFKGQWFIKGLLNLFFIMPVLTVILGVVSAYSDVINVFGLVGILIAHLYLKVPYAIRILWERLERISPQQRQPGRGSWHRALQPEGQIQTSMPDK